MADFDIATMRAQIEAELRAKIQAEVMQEFNDKASKALSIAEIAKERNSVASTIEKILEGAGVKPIAKGFRLYDQAEVRKAMIQKDKHILAYHGLIIRADGVSVGHPEDVHGLHSVE